MANVLVVDDSSTVRNELGDFLTKNGFKVALAVDGMDGLAKLRQDPGIKLIVCDVNMPNMDGLTLIKSLRGLPTYRSTPILMLTTESSDAMKQQGRAAGATGWLVKPFDPPKLLEVTKKVLP